MYATAHVDLTRHNIMYIHCVLNIYGARHNFFFCTRTLLQKESSGRCSSSSSSSSSSSNSISSSNRPILPVVCMGVKLGH
jgi:hypothetical protein